MEVIMKGEPKEIAVLVAAIQEWRFPKLSFSIDGKRLDVEEIKNNPAPVLTAREREHIPADILRRAISECVSRLQAVRDKCM